MTLRLRPSDDAAHADVPSNGTGGTAGPRQVHVSLVHPGGDIILLLFLLPEVQ